MRNVFRVKQNNSYYEYIMSSLFPNILDLIRPFIVSSLLFDLNVCPWIGFVK